MNKEPNELINSGENEPRNNAVVAANIEKVIAASGLSQRDFAKKVGISASTLTDYLKLRTGPSDVVLTEIANFAGVKKVELDPSYHMAVWDGPDDLKKSLANAETFGEEKLTGEDRAEILGMIGNYFKHSRKSDGKNANFPNEEQWVEEHYKYYLAKNADENSGKNADEK